MKEEKAAYFAQYWGQKVIRDGTYLHEVNSYFNLMHESFCLELKPLSSITDEDVINLQFNSKLLGLKVDERKSVNDGVIIYLDKGGYRQVISIYFTLLTVRQYQYLQSKGYALPFRNYSVEQLIEMGWLTLTNN